MCIRDSCNGVAWNTEPDQLPFNPAEEQTSPHIGVVIGMANVAAVGCHPARQLTHQPGPIGTDHLEDDRGLTHNEALKTNSPASCGLVKVPELFFRIMLKGLRRLAAFCLCITLSLGLITPAAVKADDAAVIARQAAAFEETKSRLPELARLVSIEDWTFTRNLIHGPMQEVGREMLYINQRLDKAQRKEAESIARDLKAALANLDEAARLQDSSRLQRSYSAVAAGFEAYSELIPEVIPDEALS